MIYEVETKMGLLVIKAKSEKDALEKARAIQVGSNIKGFAEVVAKEKDDYSYIPKEMVIS